MTLSEYPHLEFKLFTPIPQYTQTMSSISSQANPEPALPSNLIHSFTK